MSKFGKALISVIAVAAIVCGLFLTALAPSPKSFSVASPSNVDPPFEAIPLGIGGGIHDVLAEKLIDTEDETIFVATLSGLYILQQEELQHYIPQQGQITNMAVIEDISGDGKREVVITISEMCYPNVQCYNPATGELLWWYSNEQRTYAEGVGWTTLNTVPSILRVVDDNRIAYTTGNKLIILDNSGRMVNSTTAELDYLEPVGDVNSDGVRDLLGAGATFAAQAEEMYHNLYLFSGKNGKLIRLIQQIPKRHGFANLRLNTIEAFNMQGQSKAAMFIQYRDEFFDEYRLYLIDLSSGTIDWEIIPFGSNEEDHTSSGIKNVGDINDDDYDDILWLAGSTTSSIVMLYDGKTQEMLWDENKPIGSKIGKINYLSLDNGEMLVTTSTSGTGVNFTVYDIGQDGQSSVISVDYLGYSVSVYQYNADSFLYYYASGLICVSNAGDVLWRHSVTNSAVVAIGDLTGDDTNDFLLYDSEKLRFLDAATSTMCVIDGATRQKVWSYTVPDFETALQYIQIVPDLNGDGKQDIAAVVNIDGIYSPIVTESNVVEFSGSGSGGNAEILSEISIADETRSFTFLPYTPAYSYAVVSNHDLSVIDHTGSVLWQKGFDDLGYWQPWEDDVQVILVDDVNDDDLPDLGILFPDGVIVIKSDIWPNYNEHILYHPPHPFREIQYIDDSNDLDGDGVRDIVIIEQEPNGRRYLTAISTKSGAVLLELGEHRPGFIFEPTHADFNGDGHADSLILEGSTTQSSNWINVDLRIVSGSDASDIYDIRLKSIIDSIGIGATIDIPDLSMMPATPVADMTEDGIAELAVFTMEIYSDDGSMNESDYATLSSRSDVKSRPMVTVYDVAQNAVLKTFPIIEYEAIKNGELRIHMQQVGDINGNGSDDIALVTDGGLTVVDVEEESTISKFPSDFGLQVLDIANEDDVSLVYGNGLYFFNPVSELEIELPLDESSVTTPFRLNWGGNSQGTFTQVSAYRELVGQSKDDYVDLSLKAGEYAMKIASHDQYGVIYYDTINLTVRKGVSTAVYIILLLLGLVTALVAFKYSIKLRKFKFRWGVWSRKTS